MTNLAMSLTGKNTGHWVREVGGEQGNQGFVRRINLGMAGHCQRFIVGRDEQLLRPLSDYLYFQNNVLVTIQN